MQIVIAWAEQTKLVATGRYVMRDLNWFPEFTTEMEGKACMWLRKGSSTDIEKAKRYAKQEDRLVFVFDDDETDPLGRAREMAVLAHQP